MEKLQFLTNSVQLSERADGEDLRARFVLCDFGTNLNHVRLDRNTIDAWKDTIINEPLVGRLNSSNDFEGHNMRIVLKPGSKEPEVVFSTEAYGTFTSCSVENIDGHDYLCADAIIWSRYPNVVRLIEERVASGEGISTSWEILVSESHNDFNGDKVITDGRFTALCMLGRNVTPAYGCSGLLEVAELSEDVEFEEALAKDVAAIKEGEMMPKDNTVDIAEAVEVVIDAVEDPVADESVDVIVSEEAPANDIADVVIGEETDPVEEHVDSETDDAEEQDSVDEVEQSEQEIETSAMTLEDVRRALDRALSEEYPVFIFPEDHIVWARRWDYKECDFTQYDYVISNDNVVVSNPQMITLVASPRNFNAEISSRDNALNLANEKINDLQAQVDALEPYRAEHERVEAERERAEHERKVSELRDYALRSGHISEQEIESDDVICQMVSELNVSGIKQIIAERFMASLEGQPEIKNGIETSETSERADITDTEQPRHSLVMAYINK